MEFQSIKLLSFHFPILKRTFFILLILKACNSAAVNNSAAKTHWDTFYIAANNWWKNGGFSSPFRCIFTLLKIANLSGSRLYCLFFSCSSRYKISYFILIWDNYCRSEVMNGLFSLKFPVTSWLSEAESCLYYWLLVWF